MSGKPGLQSKNLLWAVPVAAMAIAVMLMLALPKFVASGQHRATIENLASTLTGRSVHISGRLSLALLPQPQFIANNVTITGRDLETITADSLTLDIAPLPLLRGQILARSLTLQSPHIVLPWPLPAGAASIAPPRWLTALHAQISDGEIRLGAVTFRHVQADIFTGGDGAFSVAGNGTLAGTPVNLSLAFGALSAVGSAPVTLDMQTANAAKLQAHIAGTYDSSSTLAGTANLKSAALGLTGNAEITADSNHVALTNLTLRQGSASLQGSATLALTQPTLTLLLSGQNLVLPIGPGMLSAADAAVSFVPTQLTLDATNTSIAGTAFSIPQLHSAVDFSAAGAKINSLDLSLPANSTIWLSGTLDPAGRLQAKTVFASRQLGGFLNAYGPHPALPATWQEASLAADIAGTAENLDFSNVDGIIGPARITGTVLLRQHALLGSLHFDQLDLTPFAAMLRNPQNSFADASAGDFELTADRASLGKIPLTHLLIDATLGNQLVIRRLTASLYGGIAAGSFTFAPNLPQTGFIGSAKAILALPSAQPIAALAPAWARPPAAMVKAPLAVSFLAAGPPDALATSAVATLGPISLTAAPTIDLLHQTAQGAFTLRHPNAIAAFKAFGLQSGLAWPGPGSIALRANLLLSASQIGLPDFDLSMGGLTANGRLIYTADRQLNGEIDADTLALPPIPASFTPNWPELFNLQGKVAISANRVLWGGSQILGPFSADLTSNANRLNLAVAQASLANGSLKGEFSATGNTAPAITAKFSLSGADASQLNLPSPFPLTLPAGKLDAAGDLTATGYAAEAWLDTLSGNASLAAHDGTLSGFNLAAAAGALNAKRRRLILLRNACLSGTTNFTQLSFTGNFNSGIYTLATATLQSASGSAAATGSIDLPDTGLNLNLTLLPPKLGLTIAGTWAAPRKAIKVSK